jgi:hypothetical protein
MTICSLNRAGETNGSGAGGIGEAEKFRARMGAGR